MANKAPADLVAAVDRYCEPSQTHETSIEHMNCILLHVHRKSVDLHGLVVMLGAYLTSADESIRQRGTLLLAEVLGRLPKLALSPSSVDFLVKFFVARLKDEGSTLEAAQGLHAIVKTKAITAGHAKETCSMVFAHADVQAYPQAGRQVFYDLLLLLLDKYLGALKELGPDFVNGFVMAMDGEKDPRCLHKVFRVALITLEERFDPSGKHAEDLFEVTSCYFPITFKTPPNDPTIVSSQELSEDLRELLTLSPSFAPFVMPFMLEKMASSVTNTQIEACKALALCARKFGVSAVTAYAEPIWASLQSEILPSNDKAVVMEGLTTLRAFTAILSAKSAVVHDATVGQQLKSFLVPIISDCIDNVKAAPEGRVAALSRGVLAAACSASDSACSLVLESTMPVLTEVFPSISSPEKRAAVLATIVEIVASARCVTTERAEHPLRPFATTLMSMFMSGLSESSTKQGRKVCLQGLSDLACVPTRPVLDPPAIAAVAKTGARSVLIERDDEVRDAAVKGLTEVCRSHPGLVATHCMPNLLKCLGDSCDLLASLPSVTGIAQSVPEQDTIGGTGIADPRKTAPTTPEQVRTRALECIEEMALCSEITHSAALPALAKAFDTTARSGDVDTSKALILSVKRIVAEFEQACGCDDMALAILRTVADTLDQALPDDLLDSIGSALRSCLRRMNVDSQRTLAARVCSVVLSADSETLSSFDPSSPSEQLRVAPVFAAILCALRPEVSEEIAGDVVLPLVNFAVSNVGDRERVAAAQAAGVIINKLPNGHPLLATVDDYVGATLLPSVRAFRHPAAERALIVYCWIAAGSLAAGRQTSEHRLHEELCSLLDSPVGTTASGAYEVAMLSGSETPLSKENFASQRFLYRQRFVTESLPHIIEKFDSTKDKTVRGNCLVAVGCLVQRVPKQVLLDELPKVLPLLLQSITSVGDVQLRTSTCTTFAGLTSSAASLLSEHVHTIVTACLELCVCVESARARLAAVQCLRSLVLLPYINIFPFKDDVVKGLVPALDDKKRLVRTAAAKCRSKWIMLAS